MNNIIQSYIGVSLGKKKISIKKQYEKYYSSKLFKKTLIIKISRAKILPFLRVSS